jgi:hypothetical protein
VIYAFISAEDYNGADRHLLKSLLIVLEPILRLALNAKSNVPVGFFLTLTELQIGERVPKDKYNLYAMRKLMTKE